MRTSTKIIAALILSTGCSQLILAAQPTGFVSPEKLETVRVEQSKSDIIQMFGQPAAEARWLNGTTSLIYDTEDSGSSNATAYIDIDEETGKVLNYSVRPDESMDSNPD